MDNGKDPASASDKRGAAVSPTEPVLPTMRQSGTFEAFGNAGQRLYVRSDRLATEIQSDFGTATYWSTMKPRGNTRVQSLSEPQAQGRTETDNMTPDQSAVQAPWTRTQAEAKSPTDLQAEAKMPTEDRAKAPVQVRAKTLTDNESGNMQGVASAPEPLITVLHESTTIVDKVSPDVDLNTLDFDDCPVKPSSERKQEMPVQLPRTEPSHNQDLLSLIHDLQKQVQELQSKRDQSFPTGDGQTVGVTDAPKEPIKDSSSTEWESPSYEDSTSSVPADGNAAMGDERVSAQETAEGIRDAFNANLAAMQTAT